MSSMNPMNSMNNMNDNNSHNNTASILYRVVHETQYRYQQTVTLSQQYLHLTPRSFAAQQSLSHQIMIDPNTEDWARHIDYFGNHTKHITISMPHQSLLIKAESNVAVYPRLSLEQITHSSHSGYSISWENLRDYLKNARGPIAPDLSEALHFLYDSPHITCNAELAQFAAASFTPGRMLLEAALDLTYRIHHEFEFDPKATTISTPLSEVLSGRRGVCQDFAHLMIGCLRSLGLPCRYISGYILTMPPPGQPRLIGADASHAWVSVFCPDLGWIDFDPTNACLVQQEHITVAWGRDFSDVTPMRGVVLGGGEHELDVQVTVFIG